MNMQKSRAEKQRDAIELMKQQPMQNGVRKYKMKSRATVELTMLQGLPMLSFKSASGLIRRIGDVELDELIAELS